MQAIYSGRGMLTTKNGSFFLLRSVRPTLRLNCQSPASTATTAGGPFHQADNHGGREAWLGFNPRRSFAITTDSYGAGETNLEASGTTGIEHALEYNKLGLSKHRQEPKLYRCEEYLHFHTYSYYDKEKELQRFRNPQPSNRHPDEEPRIATAAEKSTDEQGKKDGRGGGDSGGKK